MRHSDERNIITYVCPQTPAPRLALRHWPQLIRLIDSLHFETSFSSRTDETRYSVCTTSKVYGLIK